MPVTVDEKKYGKLLAKHLPSVIETQQEHERLAGVLMRLTIPARHLSPEEERIAALLGHLVDSYEQRSAQANARRFSPVERLEFLMEEHSLRQSDLAALLGGQPVVSAVLAGKRRINLDQARRLAERFGLPFAVFLDA